MLIQTKHSTASVLAHVFASGDPHRCCSVSWTRRPIRVCGPTPKCSSDSEAGSQCNNYGPVLVSSLTAWTRAGSACLTLHVSVSLAVARKKVANTKAQVLENNKKIAEANAKAG